jgi:hypothetical protein
MSFDLVLGALLRQSLRIRPDSPAEEVPLAPIDHAALRELSVRAPVEAPRPGSIETPVPLRRAA